MTAPAPTHVLTVGEAMVTFVNEDLGPLRAGTRLATALAGAELNVATTIASLGRRCEWVGVLGDDAAGDIISARLAAAGIAHGQIRRTSTPTGLIVRERRSSVGSRVHYWRRGSAGSTLAPTDVADLPLSPTTVVHLTGITPALSASAAESVSLLHLRALEAGALVSLDINYRAKLWSRDAARRVLLPLVEGSLVFGTVDEASLLSARTLVGPSASAGEQAARLLCQAGAATAVIKLGRAGAVSVTPVGDSVSVPAPVVREVDAVGAGDAFVGGYLVALMDGADPRQVLHRAVAAGAWAATTFGDSEVPPAPDDLRRLVGEGDDR